MSKKETKMQKNLIQRYVQKLLHNFNRHGKIYFVTHILSHKHYRRKAMKTTKKRLLGLLEVIIGAIILFPNFINCISAYYIEWPKIIAIAVCYGVVTICGIAFIVVGVIRLGIVNKLLKEQFENYLKNSNQIYEIITDCIYLYEVSNQNEEDNDYYYTQDEYNQDN